VLPADPATTLAELTERVERAPDAAWVARWRDADGRAATAISEVLSGELSEPRVAAELGTRLPAETTLFVASSMPVRDVETFFPARDTPPRVLSNRGANGIDGTVSAAFGAAASGDGPMVLLIGDVALAHDIGGLLAAGRLGLKLVVVLLNNDGGGIFHFLPVAGERDAFEEHVATPHGLDFARAADLYGCAHELASDPEGFGEALDRALAAEGTTIVEVRTDREANVALHRRVWDAVAGAL
jgi:2-succinyl-5-enolpyruvyl-6-hydroxy-3-cyclohexene-1-carboxylate synthase